MWYDVVRVKLRVVEGLRHEGVGSAVAVPEGGVLFYGKKSSVIYVRSATGFSRCARSGL